MILGTFDKLGGAKLLDEGRREYEQEGFFNSIFSNYYLPFIILTIYSFNIKEIHLTQQWFRWKPFLWQHSTKRNIKCSFFILCNFSCYVHNNIKRTFLQVLLLLNWGVVWESNSCILVPQTSVLTTSPMTPFLNTYIF